MEADVSGETCLLYTSGIDTFVPCETQVIKTFYSNNMNTLTTKQDVYKRQGLSVAPSFTRKKGSNIFSFNSAGIGVPSLIKSIVNVS